MREDTYLGDPFLERKDLFLERWNLLLERSDLLLERSDLLLEGFLMESNMIVKVL